jgi:hypothetical protein
MKVARRNRGPRRAWFWLGWVEFSPRLNLSSFLADGPKARALSAAEGDRGALTASRTI